MPNLTFDTFTVDVTAIPVDIQVALMQRTFSHKMSNEVAARVGYAIRDELDDQSADKDVLAKFREANPDKVKTWEADFRAKIVASILDGTMGVRAGGPRKDPVEQRVAKLVIDYVKGVLSSMVGADGKALKLPKDDETVLTFANGDTRTRSEMIANTTASQGERLRQVAEKQLREEARMAERAKQDAAKPEQTADSLGI